ncbi:MULTISPECIES: TonB-dependent receptor [unclassified Chelatococcus]|uniref:TonB-dependent receptor n=1 Tax=unclassified Chelatococcus TaxID=2638111 RepID=UPI001BCE0E36|nr:MULTISPECIES: TonB-dependent receptor [unclassified Chelatococcus]MBS7698368.1 TonB-dependent receptor [Chelatococcus sp. YT9]MBX3558865.1 TonB-dependent receptor [Chelatococcus sp.]
MRRFLSSAAIVAAAVSPALAQQSSDDVVELDPIVVTGFRAERSLADSPQSIQVIDRSQVEEQLKEGGGASALLARVAPGFSVSNQTISGASETYRGRDLLVLVDGVPLNTPLRDVSRILSLIDLNAVDRAELVAGASSLYGAGATGGTVNFITKKAEPGRPRFVVSNILRALTADIGRSIVPEMSVSASGKAESGIDYVVVGTGRFARATFDGAGRELPSDAMLGQGGGDRFGSANFLGKLGYDFDGSKRVELSTSYYYLNQQPRYMTNYSQPFARPNYLMPYAGQSVLEDTKSASLRYTDSAFALGSLSVLGFYNDVKKRFNYTEFAFPYNSPVYYSFDPNRPTSPYNQTVLYSNRGGVNLTIDTPLDQIWNGAKLTWGADLIHEKTWQTLTSGQDVFTPLRQTTTAAFGLLQVPLTDRLMVRGGMRYEYFALGVDDFMRPAAYIGVAARTPAGYQAYVLPEIRVTGGDFDYASPTFNLGATYKLTDTSELYGGFSQGFALPDVGSYTRRAGLATAFACPVAQPNCLPASRAVVSYASIGPEAQIVNNYELGIRGSVGRFKGSLAGFVSTSKEGVTFDPTSNKISQQKEIIWGAEFIGEYAVSDELTLGGMFGYREGRYDSNDDGRLDSWLPNNRIATPYSGSVYANYRFENGISMRIEGQAYSGRDQRIDLSGARYKIKSGATMNVALTAPVADGGEAFIAVDNVFDATLQNPTATSVRNLPTYSLGRSVSLGYKQTF